MSNRLPEAICLQPPLFGLKGASMTPFEAVLAYSP